MVYEARRFHRKYNKDAKAAVYQISFAMGLIAETASRDEAKGKDAILHNVEMYDSLYLK